MPLVFAGLMPHPPTLIPGVSKQNLSRSSKLKKALWRLEQDFYAAKPDTIVVVSPHGADLPDAFVINHSPTLAFDFSDFGDLDTVGEYKNDLAFGYRLREKLESSLPVVLSSRQKIDYGCSLPLYYLTAHLNSVKVVAISYTLFKRESHLALGRALRQVADKTAGRVALIVSTDLSHRLKKNSPDNYAPEGQEYDRLIIDCLSNKKTEQFINLDPVLLNAAGQCGYEGILILLGALGSIAYQPKIIGYDNSLGVGYLVMNFEF